MGIKGSHVSPMAVAAAPRIRRSPEGVEIYHSPTPLARRALFYVRAVGQAHPSAAFRHVHRDHDGFLIHFLTQGKLWHRVRERTHVASRGEAALLDVAEDVRFGSEGSEKLSFYWCGSTAGRCPSCFRNCARQKIPSSARSTPGGSNRSFAN